MCDEKHRPRRRPDVTRGITTKIRIGCGSFFITVNQDEEGKPFELFAHLGKSGGCKSSQTEAIARMVSLALRSGSEANDVVRQLKGIKCQNPIWYRNQQYLSCPDAIAKALEMCNGPNENKRPKKADHEERPPENF